MIAAPSPAEGHVTTAGAPGARVRRATIIGVVALLAVAIGAALGAYLLGGRGAGMGTGASYVPADAPMYVELRLQPSAEQDAAIRELLARFPPIDGVELDRPLIESLTAHFDELLAAEGVSVSWGEDVAPWFDGRIGFALTGSIAVPSTTDPMALPAAPPMLVMLGVTDPDAASAAVERILAQLDAPPEFARSEHAGVTVFEGAEGVGAYAVTGDQLLYAPSADGIRAALDAHASGETLGGSSDMDGYASRLPGDWILFGTYDFSNMLADALAQLGTESPEMVDAFEMLVESQPMRAAYAVSATADGMAMDVLSDTPTGALAPANSDRGLADEVPGDVVYFADGGNVGATLATLVESLKAGLAADPAMAEQIATAEAALGADLEELVSWIGDGAVFVGWDEGTPNAGLLLVPTDVAEARRRLGQIGSFARLAAMDTGSGISVGEHDVVADAGPVTVTTISWQMPLPDIGAGLPAAPALVLQYAVTDDRALIGFGDSFVAGLLDLDESESLAANSRFVDSVATLGGASNVGTVWMDFGVIQQAVESVIPDSGGFYEESVRPWVSPLSRFVSVTRLEGDELETHALLVVE
ncbi:MAG: DUF3352 domain-containing protein [Candidatus Limnocylindria bacterium]